MVQQLSWGKGAGSTIVPGTLQMSAELSEVGAFMKIAYCRHLCTSLGFLKYLGLIHNTLQMFKVIFW